MQGLEKMHPVMAGALRMWADVYAPTRPTMTAPPQIEAAPEVAPVDEPTDEVITGRCDDCDRPGAPLRDNGYLVCARCYERDGGR